MVVEIKQQLIEMAEPDYQKFSSALIPNINNVLGIRLPKLRKLSQQIAKGDWRSYLANAEDEYFEETMLQGMVIGNVKTDLNEIKQAITRFVPKINNWSTCDSFCVSLKVTKKHKEEMWQYIMPYFTCKGEYELRFGIVMLLNYYVEPAYIERVLSLLNEVKHSGYYVKMAVAWAISICYIKLPEQTMKLIKHNQLDDFTYNKALQKITESLQIDKETKQLIRSMKRK